MRRLRALLLACALLALVPSGAAHAADDLAVGAAAPDFTLQGSDGNTYRLADFVGKRELVLAWFPKAFTPG